MRDHIRVLAILNLVLGCFGLLGGLIVLLIFGGLSGGLATVAAFEDPDAAGAAAIVGLVGGAIVLLIVVLSIPGVIVGYGLLKLRPWARIVGIIVSALSLLHFPLGTAVGLYGMWVLLNAESEQIFREQPGGF